MNESASASAKKMVDHALKEASLPGRRYLSMCSTDEQMDSCELILKAFQVAGLRPRGGTTIGKSPQTLILDVTYQGSQIYINSLGEIKIRDEECDGFSEEELAEKIKAIKAEHDAENAVPPQTAQPVPLARQLEALSTRVLLKRVVAETGSQKITHSVSKPVKVGDEYVVKWMTNGKRDETKTYYTDDKGDADKTYTAMVKQAAAANEKS